MSLQETALFRRTLGPVEGAEGAARARLRESLLRFRERAGMLAEEIHRSMPSLTVHGGTHLDALWEMADLIAGPDYPLNPVEAFALGGAFLLHDLGLGLAAWPQGIESFQEDPGWKDTVAGHLRKRLGRAPTPEEIAEPPAEVEQAALEEWLRLRHAEQAERLGMASWQDPRGGATYHLLEDADLRQALGPILGRIAHSHWWPVSKLGAELGTLRGAPAAPDLPRDWTLDPLKIAVLLRVADAAHLDARRAPGFLRALRQPEGISREHWLFQDHLSKPYVDEDRLVFTTARPFPKEEAEAWWLCLDTLRMVEGELRQSDALLADTERSRLQARSVAGVEDARRLTDYVPVSGWNPVDARIHISNVADLVERLGGKQLYGDDQTVPLRELIQNAADAIRARRALENRSPDWGRITVRLGRDEEGSWIEVEDTGIGMSEAVLSGPLLDFGTTYWGSALMREEHPGLWGKGFEPTGRFGIGFFSVFMWGNQVRVTSRRYDNGLRETRVLEFRTGLQARPLVRPAQPGEQLRDGGTRVRVWLKRKPKKNGGLLRRYTDTWSLKSLCGWIAPALDVDLDAEEEPGGGIAVQASDWISLDGLELLKRLSPGSHSHDHARIVASNLRLVKDERGKIVGRASIPLSNAPAGVVTVGGLQVKEADWLPGRFAGILVGSAQDAARKSAFPAACTAVLSRWATEQAHLIAEMSLDHLKQIACASIVSSFGGEIGKLAIAWRLREFVNFEQIATWPGVPDEVAVVNEWDLLYTREEIRFHPHVVITGGTSRLVQWALTLAWGSSVDAVERSSLLISEEYEIGERGDTPVYAKLFLLYRNPRIYPVPGLEDLDIPGFDLFAP